MIELLRKIIDITPSSLQYQNYLFQRIASHLNIKESFSENELDLQMEGLLQKLEHTTPRQLTKKCKQKSTLQTYKQTLGKFSTLQVRNNKKLLGKLEEIGIRCFAKKWVIASYLTGRQLRRQVKRVLRHPNRYLQACCLEQLIFAIHLYFVNVLCNVQLNGKPFCFVNDVAVICTGTYKGRNIKK